MTARNGSAEWHGNLESGSGALASGLSAAEHPPESFRANVRVHLRNRALAGIPEIVLTAKLGTADSTHPTARSER